MLIRRAAPRAHTPLDAAPADAAEHRDARDGNLDHNPNPTNRNPKQPRKQTQPQNLTNKPNPNPFK